MATIRYHPQYAFQGLVMKRSDPGIFIAVEGIDGAGKTTQVDLLSAFLESAGEPVIRSKEPTDGQWGRKIRASAANGRMPLSDELTAFIEDRKEHLRDTILPALAAGKTVVLDRYFYSTIAYQGSRGCAIKEIESMMLESAPEPDAVLLLDVPPEIGVLRIAQGRGEVPNAFEGRGNLQGVRAVFIELAKSHPNITMIDGSSTICHVRATILRTLLDGLF